MLYQNHLQKCSYSLQKVSANEQFSIHLCGQVSRLAQKMKHVYAQSANAVSNICSAQFAEEA